MDPNACLDRFIDAVMDRDLDEILEAARDLQGWIAAGGFTPDDPRWNAWNKEA